MNFIESELVSAWYDGGHTVFSYFDLTKIIKT